MLSVVELNDLLDAAEDLAEKREFRALANFLDSQPEEAITADLTASYLRGYAKYMCGDEVAARQIIETVVHDDSLPTNSRLNRRLLNLRAIIEIEQGKLSDGEAHLLDLRALADAANDQKYVAFATLNLGISAQIRGEAETAICELRRAGAAFQRLGDLASLAGCAHNIGMLHREVRRYAESDREFLHAREYFEAHGSMEELVATDVERSVLLLLVGESNMARRTANLALRKAQELDNLRLTGEALRVVGMVSIDSGDYGASALALQEALSIAESSGIPLLQAEVHTLLFWTMRGIGDGAAASDHLTRAERLYVAMGAPARAHRLNNPERLWGGR
jgi:tetratricopeptide (TPR) repeat protein